MALWSGRAAGDAAPVETRTVMPAADLARDAGLGMRIQFEEACVPGTSVPLIAGDRCPKCSSFRMHRSHVRKISERVRKRLTDKRLFRCESCGWRGWNYIVDPAAHGPFPLTAQPQAGLELMDAQR
jgi:hypothetical protein